MSRLIWIPQNLFFLLTFLHNSVYAQRRIVRGNLTTTQKQYMIYLISSEESHRTYDTWICGGAIIHPQHILTSAACIEDVDKAYVVAGYNKYVKLSDLDKDACFKNTKRRVVYTYVPVEYNLNYGEIDAWSKLDIALVKVDKAYKYDDADFITYCSYQPKEISVNFDLEREKAYIHVMMLGWGSQKKWRMEGDKADLNQEKLRFVASIIIPKDRCRKYFTDPNLGQIIDKYMICTFEPSKLYENGENNDQLNSDPYDLQRMSVQYLRNKSEANTTEYSTIMRGICQNDHGGPLVTWINKTETVLGVASLFRVNEKFDCVSPNLFTSTALNRQLLDCIVQNKTGLRSSGCYELRHSNKVYKIIRRQILWEEHTKSKYDEKIILRPQISLNYNKG